MPKRTNRALTDRELIREILDRLSVLEARTYVQIGVPPNSFLLTVSDGGELVATSAAGTVTVLASP